MHSVSGFVLIVLALPMAALAQSEAKPAPGPATDDDGYHLLFDGDNLDGWEIRGNQDDFQVVDGVVRCEQGAGGQLMFYTGQQYGDFELVVEWRVAPGGNSGVFIRAPREGWPWETAYEVQISNEQPPRAAIHCTGALYGYAAVDPRPDESPNQWRRYVVRAEGERITVAVDGTQVVDYDQSTSDKTRDKPLEGFIGVQDSHGPPGTWVEYRLIKVKPLDE